jgi:hypothetical protein
VYVCKLGVCVAAPLSTKLCPKNPLNCSIVVLVVPCPSETTTILDPPLSRLSILVVPLPDPRVTTEPPGISVWELMTKAEACNVKTEAWGMVLVTAERVLVEVPYMIYEPEACTGIFMMVIVRGEEAPGISVWPLMVAMGTLVGVATMLGAGVIYRGGIWLSRAMAVADGASGTAAPEMVIAGASGTSSSRRLDA